MPRLLIALTLVLISSISRADLNITALKQGGIQNWEEKIFDGSTDYEITQIDGRQALRAASESSASSLYLKQRIDLLETPYINWSWLTKQRLSINDERVKSGDDHAARIYVVIDGGFFIWKTISLNYVWSSAQESGEVWDSPFAGDNVKMLAVQGKNSELNQWYQEKRNVYQDLIQHFGDKGSDRANLKAYRYIDGIAIMTDTDNSASSAEAYYGDIIFTAD